MLLCASAGCRTAGEGRASSAFRAAPPATDPVLQRVSYDESPSSPDDAPADGQSPDQTELVNPAEPLPPREGETAGAPEAIPPGTAVPELQDVARSVRQHFPLIQEALAGRTIASGQVLEAAGAFDHKLDLIGEAQPLDFYENYWGKLGVKRDTYWGGSTFAGYKVGRGTFEPWYQERSTNDGGEFSLGFTAPIVGDIFIDENRSALWQAEVERTRIEAIIRQQVIFSVRDGAVAYWEWVAAGANLRIAEEVLELGLNRIRFFERQAELGQAREIDLVDNQRIIVSRRAKAIDARRKVEQAAAKLALYLRTPDGRPLPPAGDARELTFPEIEPLDPAFTEGDIALAVSNRPELADLLAQQRQLGIALDEARNDYLPDMDAGMFVAQDVGMPTSSKRDKSEFELEATLTMSVPLERRKALGKIRQVRGKLAQVNAKARFTQDKVAAEVGVARAALIAASQRVQQTSQGLELARRMLQAERTLFEKGDEGSTLFSLNIREQQLAEAAAERVAAQLDYEVALADYAVALGLDAGRLAEVDNVLEADADAEEVPAPQPEAE
ncbi:TolC family protein [Botrimarina sp.]|uniref:TolC family protein n=1 Tax=Botrimarina sp. TaxID=2795802 RepID=UPI0032ED31E7